MRRFIPPLASAIWLFLPAVVLDWELAERLPSAYQPPIFSTEMPTALVAVESLSRLLLFASCLYRPIQWNRRTGWAIYLAGLVAYAAAFALLIAPAAETWAVGALAFSAPAWTPALWLFGIGLIGAGRAAGLDGLYWLSVVAFLTAHNAHALLVWYRLYG